MSIHAEYDREQWDEQGGWRGVEAYVDAVTLTFADDDKPDALEQTPEERVARPLDAEQYGPNAALVTVKRRRFCRTYERQEDGSWLLVEQGEQMLTDRQIVQGYGH